MDQSVQWWNSAKNLRAELENLSRTPEKIIRKFVLQLSEFEAEFVLCDWPVWGRDSQFPQKPTWKTWVLLGGRGAGKTRAGAEWIRYIASLPPDSTEFSGGRIALIGETYNDVRDIMIEGQSGLLSVHRKDEMPKWYSAQRKLEWPNGVIGQVFSSRDPEGLRGSQFGAVWCDAKTIWGSLVSVAAALASATGFTIDGAAQTVISDAILQVVAAIGALTAIYGRLSATDIIG